MIAGIRHNLTRLREWRRSARFVREHGGRGLVRQAYETASLRLGDRKSSGREYYDFGLYDDQRFSPTAKRQFLGARPWRPSVDVSTRRTGTACLTNKLLVYSLLSSLGLPYPRLYAVYHPGGHPFVGVPCWSSCSAQTGPACSRPTGDHDKS
jgi:hypothetical protein